MHTPIDQIAVALRMQPQEVFDDNLDKHMAQLPGLIDQMNINGAEADSNRQAATDAADAAAAQAAAALAAAADAASAATAAASSANATAWVSGQAYADGEVAWSLINYLNYRRIGAGSGTTDPKDDPAHWAIQIYGVGFGGGTQTGGGSLTSNSPGALSVTPTAPGQYLYLPSALTCPKSALQQSIYNAGDVDIGIKDYSGTVLGWIRAGGSATVGLVDNSTAAGAWIISGLAKMGITASFSSTAIATLNTGSNTVTRVSVDADRTLVLFSTTAGSLYGLIYDAASMAWGSPTLIRAAGAGSVLVGAALSASNQVLVLSSFGTAFEAVTLTISGTGITPNSGTKATDTLSAGLSTLLAPQAHGAGWTFGYGKTGLGGVCARAITISGTAPSIGAEVTIGSGSMNGIVIAGSVARVLASVGSSLICTPYTISGNTLAPGTAASTAGDVNAAHWLVNGNGNIIAFYLSTTMRAACFKLTGTTEAVTSVAVSTSTQAPQVAVDCVAVSAGKTAFYCGAGTAAADVIGILTDSAGSLSIGTNITIAAESSPKAALPAIGTTARFAVTPPSTGVCMVSVDCSGASPLLSNTLLTSLPLVPATVSAPNNARSWANLVAGSNLYTIGVGNSQKDSAHYSASGIRPIRQQAVLANIGVAGAASNESWLFGTSALGITLNRMEAAA